MPQFLIERDVPGAGRLSARDLADVAGRACGAVATLGPDIQWLQSYVTDDRIVCVYHAPDEDLLRAHAELAALPPGRIVAVGCVIDPTTGKVPGRVGATEGRGQPRVCW